jgi:hypothetical protein
MSGTKSNAVIQTFIIDNAPKWAALHGPNLYVAVGEDLTPAFANNEADAIDLIEAEQGSGRTYSFCCLSRALELRQMRTDPNPRPWTASPQQLEESTSKLPPEQIQIRQFLKTKWDSIRTAGEGYRYVAVGENFDIAYGRNEAEAIDKLETVQGEGKRYTWARLDKDDPLAPAPPCLLVLQTPTEESQVDTGYHGYKRNCRGISTQPQRNGSLRSDNETLHLVDDFGRHQFCRVCKADAKSSLPNGC